MSNTTQTVSAPDFDPFITSIAGANQNSSILSDLLSASANIGVNDNNRNSQSHFELTFSLAAPVTYQLQGSVAGSYSTASCTSGVRLLDSLNQPIFQRTTMFFQPSINFNTSNTLAPGQYTLVVDSTGLNGDPIGGSASGSFNVTFSIVPEPATLASAAMLLLMARWRRR